MSTKSEWNVGQSEQKAKDGSLWGSTQIGTVYLPQKENFFLWRLFNTVYKMRADRTGIEHCTSLPVHALYKLLQFTTIKKR